MAEEEALRMAALKKAYAEIMLNASKEAAARIVVADRKAICLEQDLFSVKKDSLHMLLRLKEMLDYKTAEAEVKSLNEQRKIDELEAQLSEAEGIIVDLRDELSLVRDKVEKAKCRLNHSLSNHGTKEEGNDKNASEDNKDSQPTLKNDCITNPGPTTKHFSSEEAKCSPNTPLCNHGIAETNKSQYRVVEPHPDELFTPCQPLNASDDQVRANKEPCSSSSSDSDGKGGGKTYSQGLKEEPMEGACTFSQPKRPSCRRPRNNTKYHEAIAALRRTSRGPRAKASASLCSTFSADDCFVDNAVHPHSRSDESPIIVEMNQLSDTTCGRKEVSPVKTFLKKDIRGEDENGGGSSTHMDVQMTEPIKVPEGSKERRASNRADDNSFKYIFRRKRKRETVIRLDENIVPMKNGVKRRELEDQRDISVMNSSILTDQQSSDTQDLLQIAHQLVSLSENGR